MRYAVLGAGPIGATLAGSLAIAGQEVFLVDPLERIIDPITKNGLHLVISSDLGKEGTPYTANVHASTAADNIGPVDVVALATKGFHTRGAIENIRKLSDGHTVILSVQNGLGNADILEEQFPGQVAYSVVVLGGQPAGPGAYAATLGAGEVHLPVSTSHTAVVPVLQRMSQEAAASPMCIRYMEKKEIDKKLWNKLCLNVVVNSINAIHEGPMDALFCLPQGIELANLVVDEALAVAHALGVDIRREDVSLVPTQTQPKITEGYRHYPSMCLDVVHHRRVEDEFINGAIVREGKKVGVPTPYNHALSLLMQIIEQSYDSRYTVTHKEENT